MKTEEILSNARKIWGDKKMAPEEIVVALGVVYGDICRLVRNKIEGKKLNDLEMKKELGNIINSTIRWCDDLGYSPEECIEISELAHKQYTAKG